MIQLNEIGLIFDMDGVIVNNHEYHFLSWQELAKKYSISIDEEFYRTKMNGRTFTRIVDEIFPNEISMEQAKEIAIEKEEIYRELFAPKLSPVEGLIDLLDAAKANGIPMAIGTSGPEVNVKFTVDGLNIRHYFERIFDERDVTKGKPDPEVYLKCAAGIGRETKHCIVFEDAVSGIEAGKNAGSKVIGLATSHKRNELQADYIVDDFTDVSLDLILNVLNEKN